MGLLDDAIRDHLELKRRRGADPSEVAREQRDVLAARVRVTEDASETGSAPSEELPLAAAAAVSDASSSEVEESVRHAVAAGPPLLDQETAEFDMELVLKAGPEASGEDFPPPPRIAGVPGSDPPGDLGDGSLSWDFPASGSRARDEG